MENKYLDYIVWVSVEGSCMSIYQFFFLDYNVISIENFFFLSSLNMTTACGESLIQSMS